MDKPPDNNEKLTRGGFFSDLFFCDAYTILNVQINLIEILLQQQAPNLDQNTIPNLQGSSKELNEEFQEHLKTHTLQKALFLTFLKDFIKIIILLFIANMFQLAIPIFIKLIIQKENYIGHLVLARSILILCQSHSRCLTRIMGNDASSIVSVQLLHKSLTLQPQTSSIINLMQVDTNKLNQVAAQIPNVILTPIQLVISIILMFDLVGISFTFGFIIIIITGLVNIIIGKFMVQNQSTLMEEKDARTKFTYEIFSQIKYIKINGLENMFKKKLYKLRQKEVQTLLDRLMMSAWGILSVWLSPQMILVSTFASYVYLGNTLTAGNTFAVISLFQTLQQPLLQLPVAINSLIESNTSIKRIDHFLKSKELNMDHITQGKQLKIQRGSFYIQNNLILSDINMEVVNGQFLVIIGDSGSGKSTLLQSILGEVDADSHTEITVSGKIAYVSQKIWIQNTTIKQNIIFGQSYDKTRYEESLKYSGLIDDVNILLKGDDTVVGEKGVTLSGGQKSRLSLARALYLNADIYLFDDPISALDINVGRYIIKRCINGYLKDKTRLLVTHALNFCQFADRVIILDKGKIIEDGPYLQINKSEYFQSLMDKFQLQESRNENFVIDFESLSLPNVSPVIKKRINTEMDDIKDLMIIEERVIGNISSEVLNSYIEFNGGTGPFIIVAFIMLFWIFCYIGSSVWIAIWCVSSDQSEKKEYYIIVFLLFGIGQGVLAYCRAITIIQQSVKLANKMHKKMIEILMNAQICQFFDRVPLGRIMNRFTKDLQVLDAEIYWNISWLYTKFGQLISNTFLNVYASSYYILFPILIYFGLSMRLQRSYMWASRELYRMEQITKAPILSYFTETLAGLQIIRSYNKQFIFIDNFCEKIDNFRKIVYWQVITSSWFIQMLGMTSFIVSLSALFFCMQSNNPALIGLILTYASQIDQNIQQTVESLGLLENGIISFERCLAYTQINQQEDMKIEGMSVVTLSPRHMDFWPNKGKIQFRQYSVAYRDDLPPALKNINLIIPSKAKVGVIGRTGAGKSTITLGLLRILEPYNGSIIIDDIDITTIGIDDVRYNMTMIMQEAVFFKGSLRENLDPFKRLSDDEMSQTLYGCGLTYDLDFQIEENGENISAGEKQLLSIARATLRKNKIILIDEATANVDVTHENLIQKFILTAFEDCTVITIAHRISTILHCDKIMVIDQGQVVEYGDRVDLIKDQSTRFYRFYHETLKK